MLWCNISARISRHRVRKGMTSAFQFCPGAPGSGPAGLYRSTSYAARRRAAGPSLARASPPNRSTAERALSEARFCRPARAQKRRPWQCAGPLCMLAIPALAGYRPGEHGRRRASVSLVLSTASWPRSFNTSLDRISAANQPAQCLRIFSGCQPTGRRRPAAGPQACGPPRPLLTHEPRGFSLRAPTMHEPDLHIMRQHRVGDEHDRNQGPVKPGQRHEAQGAADKGVGQSHAN